MVNFLWTYSHGWILVDKFYDGHQGFGQRVMDKRTMMDIKVLDREFVDILIETIERSYGCEEASTVEQVENDDIKIAGHGRDGERRSWTETKRRPMEELRRG